MGFPLFSSSFRILLRFFKLTFQNLMLEHAKDNTIIFVLYHHLHLLIKSCTCYYSSKLESIHDNYDDLPDQERVPVSTLSLLSLPVFPTNIDSLELEKQIPAMTYCLFLEKTGMDNDQEEKCVCIVCMNCIKRNHEVRMLCNCSHVFHKECIDGWIGEGKRTCPLCRSKLLLHGEEEDDHKNDQVGFGGDLWRMEEMLSLFGDDFLMGH